jgi:hypothetical protein
MKVAGIAYQCDNPDCASEVFIADDTDTEPTGVYGLMRVVTNDPDLNKSVKWWACDPDCVGLAVEAALVRTSE